MQSVLFGGTVDRRVLWIAALCLAIDLTLIGLFLTWAISGHFELRSWWIYGRYEFALIDEGPYEAWGHAKLAVAMTLVAMLAWQRRQLFLWGFTALLAIMLLSDALLIHEQLIAILHPPVADLLHDRTVDVLVKFSLAAAPLGAMALGFMRLSAAQRPAMARLAAPALVLGFWTTIVDFMHSVTQEMFKGGVTIADLIEEGGEGLWITLILIVVLSLFVQSRADGGRGGMAQSGGEDGSAPPPAMG